MRIVLVTGKGGVGKTTIAAATALRAAGAGLRTIVLSTDPAHSLADAFAVPLADGVTSITTNLAGQQLDARARLEGSWAEVRDYLVTLLDWAGAPAVEAEELSVVPGLDEVFALSDIKRHAESEEWDLVVVDCAPTAETIRLLSLPDVLAWYMQRVFPAQRTVTRLARPLLSRASTLPIAGDGVFAALGRFYDRLDGVRELLTDPEVTTARVVVTPEHMVIAEARRTFTYLSMFGYHVDAVVANRILPDAVDDPWFAGWRTAQKDGLAEIERSFGPVPLLRVPLADGEAVGLDRLAALGSVLYRDAAPHDRLHAGEPLRVEPLGDALVLSVHLPFVAKDDVQLACADGVLFLAVGPHRRAIALPDSLARREVAAARMTGERLEVEFRLASRAQSPGEAGR